MGTIVLDLARGERDAVQRAGQGLREGKLVAFPTESFYGLGADIRQEASLTRLFAVKKRTDTNPVLILVASRKMLLPCVRHVPHVAEALMDRFWPGGLTLVFEASSAVSPLLTAGSGKIGIRLSGHPVPASLAREIQGPITGTSANVSGRPPCETAGEVLESFGDGVDFILDGGHCKGGTPSTVLDVTVWPPLILRQGMIEEAQLREGLW